MRTLEAAIFRCKRRTGDLMNRTENSSFHLKGQERYNERFGESEFGI
jgi:hypothetical protein